MIILYSIFKTHLIQLRYLLIMQIILKKIIMCVYIIYSYYLYHLLLIIAIRGHNHYDFDRSCYLYLLSKFILCILIQCQIIIVIKIIRMEDGNEFLQIPQQIIIYQASQYPPQLPPQTKPNKLSKLIHKMHSKSSPNNPLLNRQITSQKNLKIKNPLQDAKNIAKSQKAKTQNTFIDNEEYIRRYNKLNSIRVDSPIIAIPPVNKNLDAQPKNNKRMPLLQLQHVQYDKIKYPVKYKILCQHLGYQEDQVYKLKPQQILQIQEEYVKKKGNQYLLQHQLENKLAKNNKKDKYQQKTNMKQDVRVTRADTNNSTMAKDTKKYYSKNYIREIFADASEKMKLRQEKRKIQQGNKKRKEKRLNDIKDRQQILGQIIYQRLAKHKLKSRQCNILKLYKDEQKIDNTLIAIIHTKIKKAHLSIDINK